MYADDSKVYDMLWGTPHNLLQDIKGFEELAKSMLFYYLSN